MSGDQSAARGELVTLVASLSGRRRSESVGRRSRRESLTPCSYGLGWPALGTARPLQGCGLPAVYRAGLLGYLPQRVECVRGVVSILNILLCRKSDRLSQRS